MTIGKGCFYLYLARMEIELSGGGCKEFCLPIVNKGTLPQFSLEDDGKEG